MNERKLKSGYLPESPKRSRLEITVAWTTLLKVFLACLLAYLAIRLWPLAELLFLALFSMKEIRIPHIRQVKITLIQNSDRPASVACCGGWANWSQSSNLLSLNIEVVFDARTTDRLLQHLSSGERRFNLEIQSRADVEPTMVNIFPNCRTENIECKFGPPLPANSDGIRYCFKIRTEQSAIRTNGERLGAGADTKDVKTLKQSRSGSTSGTNRVRTISVGR